MSSIINFYSVLPKKLKSKQIYDKTTDMSLPYRCLIVGASGSGKTNVLLNMIKLQAHHFTKIVICTRNANEPLYNFLRLKIPNPDQLMIFEGIEAIPSPENFADEGATLIVFDDLMLEKGQDEVISPFFIRGRKIGTNGISCIYLSQNFTKVPINIRRNVNFVILKKISSNKEVTAILKNYSLDCTKEALIKLYQNATKDLTDFLFIDLDAPDTKRFRHNFKKIITP